jgi:2-aminoadipate transaminase
VLDWRALLDGPADSAPSFSLEEGGISFAASRPSERLFPLDDVRAACAEVMAQPDLADILQLGSPSGYEPLRRRLLESARAAGLARPGDDLMVTNGCQQALDLIGRVLLKPGDAVAVEDPVYPGLKNLFARMGARLAGTPTGGSGMDIDALGRTLAGGGVKMALVTSAFQNPTGGTLPAAARREVVRWPPPPAPCWWRTTSTATCATPANRSRRSRSWTNPAAVLLRSFSKVAFPGLRVGWIVAPRPLVERLVEAKQLADLHTDQLSQALLLRLLETGRLEAHLAPHDRRRRRTPGRHAGRLRALSARGERLHQAPGRHERVGGTARPARFRRTAAARRARRRGLLPGRYFAVSRPASNALRLCFAGSSRTASARASRFWARSSLPSWKESGGRANAAGARHRVNRRVRKCF